MPRSAKVKSILKQKNRQTAPVCVFCGATGAGAQFAMFTPRFPPFGTACVKCEETLPEGTEVPNVDSASVH